MKIKGEKLSLHLQEKDMTHSEFANELGISLLEVEWLFAGEAVAVDTAKKFTDYFGADKTAEFIDWEALGKKNPLG